MNQAHTIDPHSVPSRKLDARIRNIGGTIIVSGPEQAFELSDSARFLWLEIDGKRTADHLARRLAENSRIDYETALDDVVELLATFLEARVLTVRAAPV